MPDAVVHYRLRDGVLRAFRQGRTWGAWDVAVYDRYRDRGFPPPPNQARALLRWARPLLVLLGSRRRVDVAVAARTLGGRVGHLEGSLRHRLLFL